MSAAIIEVEDVGFTVLDDSSRLIDGESTRQIRLGHRSAVDHGNHWFSFNLLDLDPHADLRQATAGGTPFGVISGQLNGNLYTVDFTDPAGVTPQLQNIFGQIAAILKLRLTI